MRELRRTTQEVFVPLVHWPGQAQVDFGQALVKMAGVLRNPPRVARSAPKSSNLVST